MKENPKSRTSQLITLSGIKPKTALLHSYTPEGSPPASLRLDEAESGPNLSPIPISIHGSFESHQSTGS